MLNILKIFLSLPGIIFEENITVSFGASIFESNKDITQEKIFKFTDDLLYEAKNSGRNNFVIKECKDIK